MQRKRSMLLLKIRSSTDMTKDFLYLTHWGRVTHICVSKLTIIGSDNGLSPDRHQAIIWTNAVILSIRPLGTKLSEILIAIHIFSFKKMHLKMSSGKWRPCCLGLNVIIFNTNQHVLYAKQNFLFYKKHLLFPHITWKCTNWNVFVEPKKYSLWCKNIIWIILLW